MCVLSAAGHHGDAARQRGRGAAERGKTSCPLLPVWRNVASEVATSSLRLLLVHAGEVQGERQEGDVQQPLLHHVRHTRDQLRPRGDGHAERGEFKKTKNRKTHTVHWNSFVLTVCLLFRAF